MTKQLACRVKYIVKEHSNTERNIRVFVFVANAAFGLTEERNGIEWTYYVQGDRAVIDGASMPDGTEVYGSVVVPSELGGYRVRAIDGVYYSQLDGWHGVFSSCVGIRYVEIPDGIEIVGDHSFKNCVALKTVVLGKDVVSIGVNAFSGCKSLKKMVLPNGLESIGNFGDRHRRSGGKWGLSPLKMGTVPRRVGQNGADLGSVPREVGQNVADEGREGRIGWLARGMLKRGRWKTTKGAKK